MGLTELGRPCGLAREPENKGGPKRQKWFTRIPDRREVLARTCQAAAAIAGTTLPRGRHIAPEHAACTWDRIMLSHTSLAMWSETPVPSWYYMYSLW